MPSVPANAAINEFQKFIEEIYALPDDRLYSIPDLITQEQRFTMRALKGVRKGDIEKIKTNLLIALSWCMAIANRFHIDAETELWKRFPYLCSYCGQKICACRETRPDGRLKVKIDASLRPRAIKDFQTMFETIYPSKTRSIAQAGVHLAEETGEMNEAIHNYLGQHQQKQFDDIKLEIADFLSCLFGLANSAKLDVVKDLAVMFKENCHVCHKAPCICSFGEVAQLRT
jgi:NTP pyrophosphatase (non-canonical NTP hydrolase)